MTGSVLGLLVLKLYISDPSESCGRERGRGERRERGRGERRERGRGERRERGRGERRERGRGERRERGNMRGKRRKVGKGKEVGRGEGTGRERGRGGGYIYTNPLLWHGPSYQLEVTFIGRYKNLFLVPWFSSSERSTRPMFQ